MRLISVLFILASLLLGGCGSNPIENTILGAALGGVGGAIVGDSHRAVERGAILGAIVGAASTTSNTSRQAYGQPVPVYGQPAPVYGHQPGFVSVAPPPGVSCRPDSVWDGRGCRFVGYNQYPQPMPYPQPVYQVQPGVYQADPATCSRVQLGGGRWRCQ